MIHPNTELRFINETIGYGVFSTTRILKGTIVYVKDKLEIEISPAKFNRLSDAYRKIVEKYSYMDQRGIRILSWDHAKYVNHKCECNTISTGYGFEIALQDIEPGDEITDEYGLFNLPDPFEVRCGCRNCRKVVRPTDIDTYGDDWDRQVEDAIGHMKSAYQPLWRFLDSQAKSELKDYFSGNRPCPSVRRLKYGHEIRQRRIRKNKTGFSL